MADLVVDTFVFLRELGYKVLLNVRSEKHTKGGRRAKECTLRFW